MKQFHMRHGQNDFVPIAKCVRPRIVENLVSPPFEMSLEHHGKGHTQVCHEGEKKLVCTFSKLRGCLTIVLS